MGEHLNIIGPWLMKQDGSDLLTLNRDASTKRVITRIEPITLSFLCKVIYLKHFHFFDRLTQK